jgi:hypothetical protein
VPAGGAVATGTSRGPGQRRHLDEPDPLDTLHHQLRDPVAAPQPEIRARIVVDQAYPDRRGGRVDSPVVATEAGPARESEQGCTKPA